MVATMRLIFAFQIIFLANLANAKSITQEDLTGTWIPSGEMPRESGISNYTLTINNNLSAKYDAIETNTELDCIYKPSHSQNSIFVYYCYLGKNHLITLALGGWVSASGYKQLYGYEYWLGHPTQGQIHGGLPVSLTKSNT